MNNKYAAQFTEEQLDELVEEYIQRCKTNPPAGAQMLPVHSAEELHSVMSILEDNLCRDVLAYCKLYDKLPVDYPSTETIYEVDATLLATMTKVTIEHDMLVEEVRRLKDLLLITKKGVDTVLH